MPDWWEKDKVSEPNWWQGDSPTEQTISKIAVLDPNDVEKQTKDILEMAVDLESSLDTVETNYDNLIERPKKIIPGTIIPSGVGEPSVLRAAPERTKWQKFKNFFVGDRPPLPPNADRMEKLTRAFDIGLTGPMRTFLKFGKGMMFNTPDLMWAAIKRITPEDMWVDEVRNMTLDEAMDWAGGYNPSGFQKSVGEIGEFVGRIKSVAPIAQKLGVIGNTPRDITVLGKAFETAKLFGTAAVVEQVTKGASDIIEPTEAEYGFEGPKAVLRDMALGAIFSFVSQGVKGLWSKLTPSEYTRTLKLLGLKKGATQEQITKAANSLARQYHPDKAKGFVEEFKQVVKARDLLRQGEIKDIVYRGQKVTLKPKLLPGKVTAEAVEKVPSKPMAPITPEKAVEVEIPKRITHEVTKMIFSMTDKAFIAKDTERIAQIKKALGNRIDEALADGRADDARAAKEIWVGVDQIEFELTKISKAAKPKAVEVVPEEGQAAITALSSLERFDGVKLKIFGSMVGTGKKRIKAEPHDIDVVFDVTSNVYFDEKHPFWEQADALSNQDKIEVWIRSPAESSILSKGEGSPIQRLSTVGGQAAKALERAIPIEQAGRIRTEKLAKPEAVEVKPKKKPVIPPLSKETKDILGGVDPISQIHKALGAAKAVRPITEAAKKEALRKRIGAAAGALRKNLRRSMPAEQAIQLSTGLLKGPLTEYTQLYESIEDRLGPEVKNGAYLMIAQHPDLKYFEVVNTQKSFQKLLAGSSLTPNESAQIERVFGKAFEEQLAKVTTKSDLYERLIATWKAGLLTGMKTSGLNILSTASHAVSETAKDVPTAFIDSGISLYTGERTTAFTVKGYATGWVEGIKKGWDYMKTGHDERDVLRKYDYKKTNFGTSKVARAQQAYVEFVFHLLGAEDQPWYYGAYSRSLRSQAIAQAKTKGLKGKERQAFVDNLQKNPTDEMLEWAKEDAETAIYTNRTHLGDVAKSIQRVKGGEVIVPFGRTPSAVAMQIINYSPVGVVKEIAHEIHEGKFNQRKFSQAAGRTVVGTGAMYLGVQLFKAGLIALGFPKGERERKLWELEGRKPNSIKIGDEWRDIQAFGPLGNLLVIGGYFQQALESKGSPTEAMIEAMAGGAKSFTEQTFVRGVNLAVDALTDPEASFERWFTSMSGSLVPTIVADIARAQDDRARRAVGPKERIQSRIPIYRRGLPPKIDVFGQDLPRYGGNVLETMIDPTRPSKIRQDVVVDELRRLWDKDIKVSPTLLGDKAGYDILTKEENTQLWQRAGELTYKALFGLVNTDNYSKANDFVKGQLVDFITRQSKAAAKAEIVNIKLKQGKTILKLAESGLLSIDSLEALKYFQESTIETREEKGKGISR